MYSMVRFVFVDVLMSKEAYGAVLPKNTLQIYIYIYKNVKKVDERSVLNVTKKIIHH